jgi:hypothetical protein
VAYAKRTTRHERIQKNEEPSTHSITRSCVESHCVTGLILNSVSFFRQYLSNRGQHVLINNSISQYGDISSGVPQGSILGPILFLIYTADLFKITKFVKNRSFADDTQVYYHFAAHEINDACKYLH